MSTDDSAIERFCEELRSLIETDGYTRDQIINADETGLWWRMTPSCLSHSTVVFVSPDTRHHDPPTKLFPSHPVLLSNEGSNQQTIGKKKFFNRPISLSHASQYFHGNEDSDNVNS